MVMETLSLSLSLSLTLCCVRCCCMVMESMRASCPRSASSLSTSKCWYLQGEATDVLCHALAKQIFFGTPLPPFVLTGTHCYRSSLCVLTVPS